MTPLNEFKEILREKGISVPDESLEVFRDLVDAQSDLILDSWISKKKGD